MKREVNDQMIENVWKLHKNKVPVKLIAETIGVSAGTISRITDVMKIAERGGSVEEIDGYIKNGYYRNYKDFAKRYFGITPDQQTEQAQTPTADERNTALYLQRVLEALEKQNELLEKLYSVWETK